MLARLRPFTFDLFHYDFTTPPFLFHIPFRYTMTRATETFAALGIATVIYIALYFGALPLPEVIQDKIVPVVRWSRVLVVQERVASCLFNTIYSSFLGGL